MGFSHVSMVLESPRGGLQAYQDAPVKGHLSPSGNCTMYSLGLRLVKGFRTGTRFASTFASQTLAPALLETPSI